jgi:hypothetical protein
MEKQLLTEAYKCMLTTDERAILDKYAALHQRSVNQSIRLAIAGLGVVMEAEIKDSQND